VVVATKFGVRMGEGELRRGASRAWIMRAAEDSLRRLNTDYIDLYQLHRPDAEAPLDETLRALDDLVTQGKVRYLGHSGLAGWQIADADWAARSAGRERFVSAQDEYSLVQRGVEREVLPACERFGLGFLPYFPLAAGLLSGKYRRGEPPPPGTRLDLRGKEFAAGVMTGANFDKVEKLAGWAQARGHTILELAFAWLLGHPVLSSVIAGASTPEQVRANAATAEWRLTSEEVKEVGDLIGELAGR
jgi:aryl-alcohol dehydrogenase-like predicted oxidoreductase